MRENHCEAKFCLDKKTDNAWGKTIWALLKHSETKLLLWNIVHEYREKVWSRITKSTKHVLSYITMGQALICFTFLTVFFFYDPWGFLARLWNKSLSIYSKRKLKKKLWYIFSSQAPIFVQTYVRLRQIWTIDNNRNNVFFKGKQIIAAKIGSDEGLMLDMSAVTTLTVANIHPQLNW